jgi:hypothetical protein
MIGPLRRGTAALVLLAGPLVAQDPVRIIDFGPPTGDTLPPPVGIPDSVLQAAVARFNAPATVRIYGDAVIRADVGGTLGVYRGVVRIGSAIRGDVVVINGDLLLEATGRIDGAVTVLGGRFLLAEGARHAGPIREFRERAPVEQQPNGALVIRTERRSLAAVTSSLALHLGEVTVTPRVGVDAYNRVEGFPVRLGAAATWPTSDLFELRAHADVTLRTARDATGARGPTGWSGSLALTRKGTMPLTVGLEASEGIHSTAERPFMDSERSLGALIARRDWRDWFGARTLGVFAEWEPMPSLGVHARVAAQRERSVAAVDAFSFLRADEAWRPNPLVDDGRYRVIELGATWDRRDLREGALGLFAEVGVRRVASNELSPILLPEQVRDPMPTTGYASWEMNFDVRRGIRLHPRYVLQLRAAGAGWIGGDPLTMQRRLAMGGVDPLAGYGFREISCDPRRRPDPAMPALCDRQMVLQAEVRRTVPVRVGTRVGAYTLGIEQLDLVVFGDMGSAWLAGDGPGQVPAGKLQALDEWRSDVGVGVDAGLLGAYLAHPLNGGDGLRFSLRLSRRF